MCSVAPPASHRSDPSYCRDPFVVDRFREGRVVLLVLVGVGLGERHHGAIEAVALAEVGANRDAVARACVTPSQSPAAKPSPYLQGGHRKNGEVGRPLPVAELADVIIAFLAVRLTYPVPA